MPAESSPIELPASVDRKLLVVKGREGLLVQDLDVWIVENQQRFGRDTGDYLNMVIAHQNMTSDRVLGMREVVRRRALLTFGEEQVEFVEATPSTKNIWIGEHVRLYAPDEAARQAYAGRNALQWATLSGQAPEMVVHANNGYFYPATRNDIVISAKTVWEPGALRRHTPPYFDINPRPRQ